MTYDDPLSQRGGHLVENIADTAYAHHGLHDVLLGIVVDERRGLLGVYVKPLLDGRFLVVIALEERSAALVADTFFLRCREMYIVHLLAAFAGPSAGEALEEVAHVHVDIEGDGQRHAHGRENLVEGLCLGRVSRKPVEDESSLAI